MEAVAASAIIACMKNFAYSVMVDEVSLDALENIARMEAMAKNERIKLAYFGFARYFEENPGVKLVRLYSSEHSGGDQMGFYKLSGQVEFKPGHIRKNNAKIGEHEAKVQAILNMILPFGSSAEHRRLYAAEIPSAEDFLNLLMPPENRACWEAERLEASIRKAKAALRPCPSL